MADSNPALAEALPVLEAGLTEVGATDAERQRYRKLLTRFSELGSDTAGRWDARKLQACAHGLVGRVVSWRLRHGEVEPDTVTLSVPRSSPEQP